MKKRILSLALTLCLLAGLLPCLTLGAAAASLDVGEPSVFSIQVLDACRACAYVPYGADGLEADACALLGEGLSPRKALSGDLYLSLIHI